MTMVLPNSLKYCCYTTLWNAEVVVWPFTAMNSYWVLWVAHVWAQKIIARQQNHCKSVTYLTVTYRGKIRASTNWNDEPSASEPLWVTRLLAVLLQSGVSVYALAFVLEADILSTRWPKDCVMWHIRQWLFLETITVSHVCCYSVNHSNCTLNYRVDDAIWHFKFPKVVQAHTLCEVGILGTFL